MRDRWKIGCEVVWGGVLLLTVLSCGHGKGATRPDPAGVASGAEGQVSGPEGESPRSARDILVEEGGYVFEGPGSWTRRYHLRLRCRNQACVEEEAAIRYFYDPRIEDRPQITLSYERPTGESATLMPEDLTEQEVARSDSSSTAAWRRVEGRLSGARVGDLIDLRIVSHRRETPFQMPVSGRFVLAQDDRGVETSFTLEVPEALPLVWKTVGLEGEPEIRVKKGVRKLVFAPDPAPTYPYRATYQQREAHYLPTVHFSVGGSWSDAVAGVQRQLAVAPAPDEAQLRSLRGRVEAWTRGAETPLSKVARIVAGLQASVRGNADDYSSTETQVRGLDAIFAQGHGSPLERARLLQTLLGLESIESELALIAHGAWEDVHPDIPGLDAFDRVLLRVQLSGRDAPLWIDPASRWESIGALPEGSVGRGALIISEETTGLSMTPRPSPEDAHYEEVRTFQIKDLGFCHARERSAATGWLAAGQRQHFAELTPGEQQAWAYEYLQNSYAGDDLQGLGLEGIEELEQPLTFRVETAEAKSCVTVIHEAGLRLNTSGLWSGFPVAMLEEARELEPETPLLFPRPFSTAVEHRLHYPVGFTPVSLPEDRSWRFGSARIARTLRREPDRWVVVRFEFDTGDGEITAGELVKLDQQSARLLPDDGWMKFGVEGFTLIKAGKTAEGIAALQALRAPRQDSLSVGLRWVSGLNQASLTFAARPAAQKLVEAHPRSYRARLVLAQSLERSELGEFRGEGFDYEGAVEAYRKAVALDPEDTFVRERLAGLLEVDRYGIHRTSPGPHLTEAIELQRALFEADEHDADESLLKNLYWNDDLAGAIAFAEDNPDLEVAPVVRRAALTLRHPERDSVLEAAAELGVAGESQRLQFLSRVALFLLSRGAYEDALDFARAAAAVPRAPATAHALVQSLEATLKGNANLDALPPAAKKVFEKLDAFFTPGGIDDYVAQFEGLGEEEAEATAEALRRSIEEQTGPLRKQRRLMDSTIGLNLPDRVSWEISRGAMRARAEGSDEAGYRLTLTWSGRSRTMVLLLAPTRQGLMITAVDPWPPVYAREIRRLAREGRDEALPQWVGWMGEQVARLTPPAREGAAWTPGLELGLVWKDDLLDTPEGLRLALALILGEEAPAFIAKQSPKVQAAMALTHLGLLAREADSPRQWRSLLGKARKIEAPEPARKRARQLEGYLLFRLGEHEAAVALWSKLLEEDPEDQRAFEARTKSEVAIRSPAEVLEEDVAHWKRVGEPPRWINNLAWMAVIAGAPLEPWLERMQGTASAPYYGAAHIHTEATLLAELGRHAEALSRLAACLGERDSKAVQSHDWYVLGRVAEGLGLPEAARSAYQKTLDGKNEDNPLDTSVLAEKRMRELKR